MNQKLRSTILLCSVFAVGTALSCSSGDVGEPGTSGGAAGAATGGGGTGGGGTGGAPGGGGTGGAPGGGGTSQGGTGATGTGATGGTGGGGGACSNEGEQQTCYDGLPGTDGVGICKTGTKTCTGGSWTACVGQVIQKAAEECNGEDDDCNGLADEGLTGQTTCGQGTCQVTVTDCVKGVFTPCVPGTPNPTELCDKVDDNCNGSIDEGCVCNAGQTQQCYSGASGTKDVGPCKGGTQSCPNGQWGACVGEVTPETESCNGIDDDCDGTVDDGTVGLACSTGKPGICATGTSTCAGGVAGCTQTVFAGTEVCDGKDNDCDGLTDEGNPGGGAACSTGKPGPCGPGTMTCSGGLLSCVQNVQPTQETCDSIDNDCDGQVDEQCKCPPGTTQPCYTGPAATKNVGICKSGTQTCKNNGQWDTACVGQVLPGTESCGNNTDDDCDGQVNEGCAVSGPRIMIVGLNEGHNGNLGGIAGANSLCATQAAAAGMPGTWKAFLSSSTQHVKDLFVGTDALLQVVDKNNVTMYPTWTGVFTTNAWSPAHYFVSFKGQVIDEITVVSPPWTDADGWHGSNIDGTFSPGYACADWTSADSTLFGHGGEWDFYRLMTSGTLVETYACSYTAAVACVSKQL